MTSPFRHPRGCHPGCAALLVALAAALGPSAALGQSKVGSLARQVGIDQRLGAQVPLELKFRDETGREVALQEYFNGKPVVLTLVYYRCPMLCNQVLNGFLRSANAVKFAIGDDYQVVTVSIDPAETPTMAAAKKKRYLGSYHRPGGQHGWHFLTGSAAAVEQLARTVGFRYRYDERSGQFAHASGIMVLTPGGKVARYLYGIEYPVNDLRLALVESSAGQVGSPVDQFLLLCYHYDPMTGKYGLVIHRALRGAGVVTVLALGGFMWVMFRRERRLSKAVRASADPRGDPPEDREQHPPG